MAVCHAKRKHISRKGSLLVGIQWARIVLDEAHIIKNKKTKAAKKILMLRKQNIPFGGPPVDGRRCRARCSRQPQADNDHACRYCLPALRQDSTPSLQ
ncbi:hypothetical protein KIN20_008780 [Parelaphostrongylus tenuis]|uniref:SNF2 N-terminal domain-containing protein n=1 Tax=Parelaphostrongylus tenuis TaxID=148309 RepID=A0AAD5QKS9_PARTN|nr:hypothetical protein KIN20_008780 [Parelaphostrongylus tenuis]